jgi:hypothetical protein
MKMDITFWELKISPKKKPNLPTSAAPMVSQKDFCHDMVYYGRWSFDWSVTY